MRYALPLGSAYKAPRNRRRNTAVFLYYEAKMLARKGVFAKPSMAHLCKAQRAKPKTYTASFLCADYTQNQKQQIKTINFYSRKAAESEENICHFLLRQLVYFKPL